jgi:dipeptidyl aminopeptidase/acylaminoacyl peptidase
MPDDLTPDWVRRYTAPRIGLPRWSTARPERLAFISSESGIGQAWAADLHDGSRRRISDERIGVEDVFVTPDGEFVVWWHDATGDEKGRWLAVPFAGGDVRPLVPDVPDAWAMGIAMARDVVALGLSDDEGYAVYVTAGGEPARRVYLHDQPAGVGCEWPQGVGGLSSDGALVCVRHAEHGDILHHAIRVLDVRTGAPVGDQEDPGRRLDPAAWSPVPGDHRLAVLQERGPFDRPAIWNLDTGAREDLEVPDLPGDVFPVDWYPDGSALLVRHEHEGIDELLRLDLATGTTEAAVAHRGQVLEAAVRPDGRTWLFGDDAVHPSLVMDDEGGAPIPAPAELAPDGTPFRSFWFENPAGQRIQAWVATPPGEDPFPTIVYAHGGPEWHFRDGYDEEILAYVDHGFAVAMVNYRGSTGYGVAFREVLLRGNIGFPESEDLLACLDALIAEGTADRDRSFFAGWSWGGYLACLNVGINPDRYKAVFAGIPVGDYVQCHADCSPPQQAWDVATLGGSPEDVPEVYRRIDPMTYIHQGRAPVLIIAGRNDSRCPLSSAEKWAEAYRAQGGQVEMHVDDNGHHTGAIEERARHAGMVAEFFRSHC